MCPGEKRSPPLHGQRASVLVPQASGTRGASLLSRSPISDRWIAVCKQIRLSAAIPEFRTIDTTMWKSVVGHNVSVKVEADGDDWDTDPDFVNDVSEQEQRWGAKTIEGSGRSEHFSVHQLREHVSKEHEEKKKKELAEGPKASYGYGGKFGVEKDRMDKVAMGHGYVAEVDKHSSQTDAAQGFGGKYGVQKDRIDKSAVGFEYKGQVEQHASQKGKRNCNVYSELMWIYRQTHRQAPHRQTDRQTGRPCTVCKLRVLSPSLAPSLSLLFRLLKGLRREVRCGAREGG
ncbi:hematopoietic lineage cell-specific protein-like [Acipenser oxyrinchus oxyrinchus]|uniref:Hematopoietic lineage cell-specific protein-like n=1 Tax=Acipenser oxyrinchus oxyrinchus TaxID=40147 RepID=A0AAD8G705_ACIOX|nr:hematopoietic lineage cell-specific protein-like [Acipenser oxyrinchus oxyrinchus]